MLGRVYRHAARVSCLFANPLLNRTVLQSRQSLSIQFLSRTSVCTAPIVTNRIYATTTKSTPKTSKAKKTTAASPKKAKAKVKLTKKSLVTKKTVVKKALKTKATSKTKLKAKSSDTTPATSASKALTEDQLRQVIGSERLQLACLTVTNQMDGMRVDRWLRLQQFGGESSASELSHGFIQKLLRTRKVMRLSSAARDALIAELQTANYDAKSISGSGSKKSVELKAEREQQLKELVLSKFEKLREGKTHVRSGDWIAIRKQFTSTPAESANEIDGEYQQKRDKKRIRYTEAQAKMLRSWVLFENADVIVLNKPSGIPVQGGTKAAFNIDAMLSALKSDPQQEEPRLVHRLDKDTSGVLVLAKNRLAATELQRWFRDHSRLKKCYWAFVLGKPKPSRGRIKMAIGKSASSDGTEKVRVADDDRSGKMAVTEYMTVDVAGDEGAFVVFYPISGRTHQIRVHAASALNTPILGDFKYGIGCPDTLQSFIGEDGSASDATNGVRLHLHARKIILPYFDKTGKPIVVKAPLPAHMKHTWESFGFNSKFDKDITADGKVPPYANKNVDD